jgi:hypothetical protein
MSEKLSPCGLFAKRDSLAEALEYANTLIAGIRPTDRVAAFTALHVVLNTALAEIAKLDPTSILPYPDPHTNAPKSIKQMTREEISRSLRTALPHHGLHVHLLDKISPKLAEPHSIFFMLVCKYFEIDAETIADEMVNSLSD